MPTLTRPLNMQLEITDKCNLRCEHCYHLDFDCDHSSQDLPDDSMITVADKLVEAGIFGVVITGGEPLVRRRLACRLVGHLKKKNTHVSLNTNLLLLDAETLGLLRTFELDAMLVSCASSNPDLYTLMTGGGKYAKFENNLKMLIASGQRFAINMVVNRQNISDIRQTAVSMRDLGVKIFGATPMALNLQKPEPERLLTQDQVTSVIEELIWIKDNLHMDVDIFEAIPKCAFPPSIRSGNYAFVNRKCQAGKTIASVSNTGDIRPCSHNPASYGNILAEPIETIWERMTSWRNADMTPETCLDCSLVKKCYGGCRITAKAWTGQEKGHDPWMTGPLTASSQAPDRPIVHLLPDMTAIFAATFRWRKETDGVYTIASSRGNKNVTMVNESLFRFVTHLKDQPTQNLEDLARSTGNEFNCPDFQRVVSLLASREFISLSRDRKEGTS